MLSDTGPCSVSFRRPLQSSEMLDKGEELSQVGTPERFRANLSLGCLLGLSRKTTLAYLLGVVD